MAVDKSPPKSQALVRAMRTCTLAGTSAMSCNRLRGEPPFREFELDEVAWCSVQRTFKRPNTKSNTTH